MRQGQTRNQLWLALACSVGALHCRHAGSAVIKEAAGSRQACRKLDGGCGPTLAEVMLASTQLPASSDAGLLLADSPQPKRPRTQSEITAYWLAKLAAASTIDHVEGTDYATKSSLHIKLARFDGTWSGHDIFSGLLSLSTAPSSSTKAVFVKPDELDPVISLASFNNGYLDYQITQMLRQLHLPGLTFPAVYYLGPRDGGYGEFEMVSIQAALVIEHAAEDGKTLVPLLNLLKPGGGLLASAPVTIDGKTVTIDLPPAIADKLSQALQIDAFLRMIFDDADGHAKQFLVNLTLDGSTVTDATLVSLDRGGAGSSLGFSILGRSILPGHDHRLRLLEQQIVDLNGGFSVPLVEAMRPTLAQLVGQIEGMPLDKLQVTLGDGSAPYDAQYIAKVRHNLEAAKATLSGASSTAGDARGDPPDVEQDDDQRTGGERTGGDGRTGAHAR